MKKFLMSAIALMMAMSVNAQNTQKYLNESTTPFEESKFYVGASLSGLTLNYSKASEWSFGLSAKAGYLFLDNWMVLGVFDYQNYSSGYAVTTNIGAGVRYFFERNGIFVGLTPKYAHSTGYDDFMPEVNVGYAFFLGHYATLEPELYYEQSFKSSSHSGFGLRLGFGVYF
jgi:hypothetical protein